MIETRFIDRALRSVVRSVARALDQSWAPPVTVSERAHEIVFSLDVAEIAREKIDISISRGRLIYSGVRRANLASTEAQSRFRRSIALPRDVDARQISTELRQGVLRVRVGRRPPCTPLA
jgi:HSP20 family molecular chaperone IbpA